MAWPPMVTEPALVIASGLKGSNLTPSAFSGSTGLCSGAPVAASNVADAIIADTMAAAVTTTARIIPLLIIVLLNPV